VHEPKARIIPRGKEFVVAYGLSKDMSALVRGAAKSVGASYWPATVITDILAVPNLLLLCDFSKLSREEISLQYGYMTEVNLLDPDFRWVLIGEQALRPPKALRDRLVRPEPLDERSVRVVLLRQLATTRRRRQKAAAYDRRLYRLMWSLKQLRSQKFVKAKDLCAKFNVNARTVARDMQLLQDIGEMIEYDPHAKAYRYLLDTPWPGER
jgi:hypothetical protein